MRIRLFSSSPFSIAFSISLACSLSGCADHQFGDSQTQSTAESLRELVVQRVGDVESLQVPRDDADLPQPEVGGVVDPRFAITEAKRYLGKQLFFDPIRTTHILPRYGGVPATAQTGSCGSCHLGEAAGKAGQVVNLHLAGEGRGYFTQAGEYKFDRRVMPGMIDTIPTGVDVFRGSVLIASGRFDAVDSVPRLSPSMIGFGFNNRLLLGGKAGQADGDGPGAANPMNLPAAENLAEIASDAHRMLTTQSAVIQAVPAYVVLFREAFPEEAALADLSSDLNDLINDHTIARAVATFLRTVVTRDTPWDRFLAGDDAALSAAQLRGARLFLTSATKGGAGCIQCHSGPMLNKQLGDEEGDLVEQNFYDIGVGDHPLQELARQALSDPTHHDVGRGEITGFSGDNFKFRVLTLRQLKDGKQFMHNALFSSVREVVEYFNAGLPADANAIASGNVTTRFTQPRGVGAGAGLGLSAGQVADLTEFLEGGLYDPAFVVETSGSPTKAFELTEKDVTYSLNRPTLAAAGAVDGLTLGGKCPSNDDALSRVDRGLDMPEVTGVVSVSWTGSDVNGTGQVDHVTITNLGTEAIRSPLMFVVTGLGSGQTLVDATGTTVTIPAAGLPYKRVAEDSGFLAGGGVMHVDLHIDNPSAGVVGYGLRTFSGTKKP